MEVAPKYHLLLELLRQISEKGFGNPTFTFREPGLLAELLNIFGFTGRLLDRYIKRYFLTASIPKEGSSPDDVYKSAWQFVQAAGITLSCNMRFASVVEIFQRFAAQTASIILENESKRLEHSHHDWIDSVREVMNESFEGSVDQAELLTIVPSSPLPVIGGLSQKIIDTKDKWEEAYYLEQTSGLGMESGTVWDLMSSFKLEALPNVKGINPTRASYKIAGARATWALKLAVHWKCDQQGLKAKLS
jgi:hypothetical protein